MTSLRRAAFAMLVVGVLAGAVVAIAVPKTRTVAPRSAGALLPAHGAPTIAAAYVPPRGEIALHLHAGTMRTEVTAKDPAGGPDWQVRAFVADHWVGPGTRRLTERCAQLGRVVHGRFGWIDASNTFRPVGVQFTGAPWLCGSPKRRAPLVETRTLVTDPLRPDPQVRGVVTWGLAGTRGAFVRFAGPAPGTQRLEARAPDPGGGPSWGLLAARGHRGGWCFGQPVRIVGDRAGEIDWRLGTLHEDTGVSMSCADPKHPLTRKRPFTYGRIGDPGIGPRDPDPGRTLLRTLRGHSLIYGITRPDVKLLTIATPRDVRTLVPSARAHAFVAVYDGDFPSGTITLTATFTDGTTVSHSEPAGL